MPQFTCLTPLGEVTLTQEDDAIVALDWGRGRDQTPTPLLREAIGQLQDYFDGTRTAFTLPLAPHGSAFQSRVWQALRDIPHGEVRSYGDLARHLGTAARAIGQANGANPIPILIPCHRVVAAGGAKNSSLAAGGAKNSIFSAGGALGGYSGGEGPETKRFLLTLEARLVRAAPGAPPQAELFPPKSSLAGPSQP